MNPTIQSYIRNRELSRSLYSETVHLHEPSELTDSLEVIGLSNAT